MTKDLLELVGAGRMAVQQVRQDDVENLCLLAYRRNCTSADRPTSPNEHWTRPESVKLCAADAPGQVHQLMLVAWMNARQRNSKAGDMEGLIHQLEQPWQVSHPLKPGDA